MSLLLGIETSSKYYSIVLADENEVIFDSSTNLTEETHQDLSHLLTQGLTSINQQIQDIQRIAVDVGPGSLSTIRVGVSFANALAFSLQKPIFSISSFDMTAFEARQKTDLPLLCVRTAGNNKVYAGLFKEFDLIGTIEYGSLTGTVQKLTKNFSAIAVAGALREQISILLPQVQVVDTDIEIPQAKTLARIATTDGTRFLSPNGLAIPITEQSPMVSKQ